MKLLPVRVAPCYSVPVRDGKARSGGNVRVSEIGTVMVLLSAYEDLVLRTFPSLPGLIGRLDYVAGLRGEAGEYEHWGLSQAHDLRAAQAAFARAHTELWLEVLRTPVTKLQQDLLATVSEKGQEPLDYVEQLVQRGKVLVPGNLGGGSVRHFNCVLLTLSSLSRGQPAATRRAA